jgi:hypothetical protein
MAARRGGWRRDAAKERHWRRVVREWRRSGLSVRDFCDWQTLSEPSFYAWRREIAKRDHEAAAARGRTAPFDRQQVTKPAAARRPAFVPVQVVADEPLAAFDPERWLEVQLPTGAQLRVPAGFDRQTLADVLAALENRSC